jgi:hypothetical protein
MLNEKTSLPVPRTPVRKIGVRTTQVRGRIAKNQEYESLLERDYLTLLRMDPTVESFITQPIKIPYELDGTARTYVPDVLVSFKRDSMGKKRPPKLVEVKPAEYADHPDDELAAKFAAANLFCEACQWMFEIATEVDIQTPRLTNADFLMRYKGRECDPSHVELIRDQLRIWNGCATPKALLAGIFRSSEHQARLLPDLWTMVLKGDLYTDLNVPLTMLSEIWSPRP